ncbi:Sulfate-transporting ATPase [Pseudobacteroides cellulosolvens ATCC 35603 = DSM 2933]|uniref:Sulfate-transporting ATPase n=1 Tax=Pseudobacteroides cellulosolvens ATCC 35603 = DSM 2933 TaxID=398512 RepID=A0A0L6JWU3_9FIRM|nr:Sulfate-transporting ATPase [Pseudobacteroides cellulosolvens ATCC 35603 = DSM 2933]
MFLEKAQAAVKLESLSKRIGKKLIIDNISMSMNFGEVFGLLGPNGAGKTTIIRMIAGLIKPTCGNVYINGVDVQRDFEKAISNIGTIIENPEFYKHLSGYLNLKIMANMYPDVNTDRINEVVKMVGLTNSIKDRVRGYSLGMRQRLGIAAALLNNPRVLVLDEPTNGLDPAGIREMRDRLRELAHKDGICVIISSHLLSEMELICDRFAIIDKGIHIETKDIEMTGDNENLSVSIEMLKPVNPAKLEKILSELGIRANSISETNLDIEQSREVISKVIGQLVRAEVDIVSVIPSKKTLEEYFIEKTGAN